MRLTEPFRLLLFVVAARNKRNGGEDEIVHKRRQFQGQHREETLFPCGAIL